MLPKSPRYVLLLIGVIKSAFVDCKVTLDEDNKYMLANCVHPLNAELAIVPAFGKLATASEVQLENAPTPTSVKFGKSIVVSAVQLTNA